MPAFPQIIAHRGASHDAPENTLASIALGFAQKADAAEIDIHLTRDGEIVLLHDHDLKRTAGLDRKIGETDFAEVRALDAGVWKGGAFAGEKVPTLAEALAAIPAGKGIVIELKDGPAIVPGLRRALEAGGVPPERVFLIAFDHGTLRAAKAALPRATTLHLAGGSWENKTRTVADLDALIAQARAEGFDGLNLGNDWPIDAAFVKRVHDAGLKFYVWTVNDAERARHLAASGVDGITTDRPGWIREALPEEAAAK